MRTSKHKKISANELYKSQENALTLMRDGSYIKITSVEKEKYGGDVYCFTTKTGNFVAKYDDIEFVSSNSGYQSAQVGVETLIRRLESWRHTLAEWIEENIFKPISQMQGFIDEEETEEIGETTYLYPTIKWNDLNLKDQTQWHQILMQLFDKQVISQQTLMEELGLNYDQEVKRQRWESMQAGPAVAMMQPGASGGDMGGIPMGGMGGGGAPPPAGDMMGGGVSEMGAPGGDMGLGGGAGGDMMGGGMPGSASASGKIMKKGKENKKEEEQPQQVGFIKLTQVEQKLAAILHHATSALHVNVPLVAQFPIQNPKGYKPYSLDFAIPQIKLGFEADGEIAHNSPDQIAHDKERDFLLGKRGWTILRFDDQAIDENPQDVTSTIIDFLHRAINKGKGKKFAEIKSGVVLYKQAAGKLINLKGDYNKYHDGYK